MSRFWSKVAVAGFNECWEWTAYRDSDGYGTYRLGAKKVKAHRYAYQIVTGLPIPEGLVLDHLCRNRACVNPSHLEPVTPGENTLRGETPSSLNARKTHCIHGHAFTPENTARNGRGRKCRTCQRWLSQAKREAS